jgi:hypothetical protein
MRFSLKGQLALDVVEGRKTDTYRKVPKNRSSMPVIGDRASLCVNAGRRDFAIVEIVGVALVAADDMDSARRELVASLVGVAPEYLRLTFRLVAVHKRELIRQNLKAFREWLQRDPLVPNVDDCVGGAVEAQRAVA